jgi:hypothetical protein
LLTADEIRLPHDAAGYARRSCPRCRAHFKVRLSRRDEHVLASAIARRAHAVESSCLPTPPRHCPYCGEEGAAEEFWTEEQLSWADAQARRLAREVRWRTLAAPLQRLGHNPRPTYIPVDPGERPPLAPRDPPDDLVAVPLPCCGEEQKVSGAWVGPVRCHYCGFIHARDLGRDIGMEIALLRAWAADP